MQNRASRFRKQYTLNNGPWQAKPSKMISDGCPKSIPESIPKSIPKRMPLAKASNYTQCKQTEVGKAHAKNKELKRVVRARAVRQTRPRTPGAPGPVLGPRLAN